MERGFTLLELLVVMTIMGVLFAITVPQYTEYRRRAFDVRAKSDLRMVALAEESYFLDSESYLNCIDSGCSVLPGIPRLSPGVSLTVTASATGFVATATHARGSGRVHRWDSSAGGLIE